MQWLMESQATREVEMGENWMGNCVALQWRVLVREHCKGRELSCIAVEDESVAMGESWMEGERALQ